MEFDLEIVQGFIQVSQRATTPGEINAVFLNTVAQFGCEYLAATTLRDFSQQPVSPLSVVTYPDEWKRRYAEMNYHQQDPVIDLLRTSRTPFYWGDTDVCGGSKEQLQFLDEGRSFGVGRGLSMAVPIANQETAAITIVGDKLEKGAAIKHMFHLIATYYHLLGANYKSCRFQLQMVQVSVRPVTERQNSTRTSICFSKYPPSLGGLKLGEYGRCSTSEP